jgi:hypothetical protein
VEYDIEADSQQMVFRELKYHPKFKQKEACVSFVRPLCNKVMGKLDAGYERQANIRKNGNVV